MITNHTLIAALVAGAILGACISALLLSRAHNKALRRLTQETSACLENETARADAAIRQLTDIALLTARTKDTLAENTKLMRILRNIVDPTATSHRRTMTRRTQSGKPNEV